MRFADTEKQRLARKMHQMSLQQPAQQMMPMMAPPQLYNQNPVCLRRATLSCQKKLNLTDSGTFAGDAGNSKAASICTTIVRLTGRRGWSYVVVLCHHLLIDPFSQCNTHRGRSLDTYPARCNPSLGRMV